MGGGGRGREYLYLSAFSSVEKRRRFCEEFARTNGFDPLVAQNWYPRKSRLKHAQVT